MSGNPFRRNAPAINLAPDDDGKRAERTPSPFKVGKKEKRVKIQTPPHSPEEPPRRLSAGRISPPPPETTSSDDESDSTATADVDLEQAVTNTRRNSGSLPPPAMAPSAASSAMASGTAPPAANSGTGAPQNPFARTLATSEAAFGLQKSKNETYGAGQMKQEGGKKGMDVDMFKNILMTGSPAPTPPSSQRPQESSSSTDTSSTSRPSLFDQNYDLHPESPRSSFDSAQYSEDEHGGDEKSGLMGTNEERLDHFAPPAPPKPGQVRASRVPQTVSFADFGDSMGLDQQAPSIPNVSPTEKTAVNRAIPPVLHRQESDLNKPLPAPPPLSPSLPQEQPSSIESQVAGNAQSVAPSDTSTYETPKKAPPPPPTSRRAGQTTATTPNRPRSISNTTQSSVSEQVSPQPRPQDSAGRTAAPPPPPSRKSKPAMPAPSPAAETPTATSAASSIAETENKNMPPPQPPPRRHPSNRASDSLHRSPSTASHSSIARSEAATGSAPPPAPPPRRAVGSKRQSLDGYSNPAGRAYDYRRSSQNSFESARSGSLSKPRLESESEGGMQTPDKGAGAGASMGGSRILDDMSAFQAEIDALRVQAGKGD